jgi:hypoxanthine phosphoribosyltransferase
MTSIISASDIHTRVAAMGADIRRDHPGDLHLIGVLQGAFVFLADLVRTVPGEVTVDFIALSSYGARTSSSGQISLLKDLDANIEGRAVVIVEDIVDSGTTLVSLQAHLRGRNPRSLRTACLLSKKSRRLVDVPVDYVGFEIDDRFVVGYGLDHGGRHRNLPEIAALDIGAPAQVPALPQPGDQRSSPGRTNALAGNDD